MNRRTLLKSGVIAGIAAALPARLFAGKNTPPAKDLEIGRFRRTRVGEAEITLLSDGFIHDADVEKYAPRADTGQLKDILRRNFRSDRYIDMGINVALVKIAGKVILCDSGLGRFADKTSGLLLGALKEEGLAPEDITDVLISHAHLDHIGGLTDDGGGTVFKNAVHHISRTEVDFWNAATVESFAKSGIIRIMPAENLKALIERIRTVLSQLGPRLRHYAPGESLHGVFTFEPVPGHTPGMMLTKLSSGGESLVFVADLIHSDILLFPHPEWGFYGDTDLDRAIATRRRILSELAKEGSRVVAYHLPYPGLGHVSVEGGSYRWIPEAFFSA